MRPTVLEISLENFLYNVKQIQSYVGDSICVMPVVKANAYGTYLNYNAELMNSFSIVAVAISDEGKELREHGYNNEIFILNQPSDFEIDTILDYNLSVGVANFEFLKRLDSAAQKKNKKVSVHLEIETGMNRTGFFLDDLKNIVSDITKLKNISVEGMYSHLSSADESKDYTDFQITNFNNAKLFLENHFDFKYIHLCASSGILNCTDLPCNTIRPGLLLHGYSVFPGAYDKLPLLPVARLKSKITFLKNLSKGSKIGYSGSYTLAEDSRIATVPIGYADGLDRSLSNNGSVIVNGKLAPIVGKICMDSFMIDVSNIEEDIGDDVFIWDNKLITLEDVANNAGTISYEILSRISPRVPRKFI